MYSVVPSILHHSYSHSEWFHLGSLNLSRCILLVSIVATPSADNKVRLLVDVSIVGIEVLTVVIVEHSWFSIVLHHDLAEGAHILAIRLVVLVSHISLWTQPWVVVNSLHLRLSSILLVFEREVVNWIISWLVTPIGAQVLGILPL